MPNSEVSNKAAMRNADNMRAPRWTPVTPNSTDSMLPTKALKTVNIAKRMLP